MYISPQWVPVEIMCISLCLPVSLSIYIYFWLSASLFGDHKIAARNYAQCMRPQAMVPNTLSGSIICPYSHPIVRRPFVFFVFLLNIFNTRDD